MIGRGRPPAEYEQPDGPVIRPWDRACEYLETYPMRVPPQFVVVDQVDPEAAGRRRRHFRRRELVGRLVVVAVVVAFVLAELAIVYGIVALNARLFVLRLLA